MMAAANQRSSSGTSLYDSISNSHGAEGQGQAPPGLPGRSSRFARFFDGRAPPRDPQAAALAAQQKMLESMSASQPSPASGADNERDASTCTVRNHLPTPLPPRSTFPISSARPPSETRAMARRKTLPLPMRTSRACKSSWPCCKVVVAAEQVVRHTQRP